MRMANSTCRGKVSNRYLFIQQMGRYIHQVDEIRVRRDGFEGKKYETRVFVLRTIKQHH